MTWFLVLALLGTALTGPLPYGTSSYAVDRGTDGYWKLIHMEDDTSLALKKRPRFSLQEGAVVRVTTAGSTVLRAVVDEKETDRRRDSMDRLLAEIRSGHRRRLE